MIQSMKTICAVILGFITLIVGGFVVSGIAFLIEWLASASSGGLDFIHGLHRLLMLVLEPGIGAFFAVYVPCIFFHSVRPKSLFVAISLTTSLFVILTIISGFSIGVGIDPLRRGALLQLAAIIGGAYVGLRVTSMMSVRASD